MNKIMKLFIVFSLGFMCYGCVAQSEKVKVAVIVKSTTSQFFKSVASGANAASKEYNIDLQFMGPNNEEDYMSQVAMIEKAIQEHVDAIVLSSIDYKQLVPPVEKAIEKGIPVVIIDSDVDCDKVASRIATNNYEAGIMASVIIEKQKKSNINVGIVNFDAHTANGQERENGFKQGLKKQTNIESVETINVQSNIESATIGTKKILADHPNIDLLVTFNEWTTLGVGKAMEEEGLNDKIFVIGFDNNPISVGMLETGALDALVVQNPFVMGYLGVERALDVVNKKHLKEVNIFTKTVVINKENMFDKENQKIVFPFE
ncbi:MAG: substrate-binding domain-containing protein [Erysipelotrichaceae bacterium]